ncbi:MAG: hypothetical protein IJF38_01720, partial [Clostridia bacterium]|nr:hypothetical protein [Clostridia bacterium]
MTGTLPAIFSTAKEYSRSRSTIKMADVVEIVGLKDENSSTVVTGIEMFHKMMDVAEAGDNVG